MSTVRIFTRLVPAGSSPESVSSLLAAHHVDEPTRTASHSVGVVSAETTYCRAVPLPPDCPDPDAAAAERCGAIPGLTQLRKSRLRLVTEADGEPRLKVFPEVAEDGSCTGMLLSIPLRIPRSEILRAAPLSRPSPEQNGAASSAPDSSSDTRREPNQNNLSSEGRSRHPHTNGSPERVDSAPTKRAVRGALRGYIGADGRCVLCGFVCGGSNRGKAALRHLATHHGGDRVRCDVCGKSFGSLLHLQYHRKVHTRRRKGRQFTCEQCGEKFPGKKGLVLHGREAHGPLAGVRCPFCALVFATGKEMRGHMEGEHAPLLPHACSVCGERFREEGTLRDHSTQHRRERRFECGVCGKGFNKRAMLQGHRSEGHPASADGQGGGVSQQSASASEALHQADIESGDMQIEGCCPK